MRILIADDDAISRSLLREVLSKDLPEAEFMLAQDGEQALELARSLPPDIVLLDLLMPKLDGFLVLAAFKSDPSLNCVPVLVITMMDDLDSKVKGFRLGAADYLMKPFNGLEVRARVESQLRMKQYCDQLRRSNDEILRAQNALIENSRMSDIGNFAAGVAHEFNNVLFIMRGYLDVYSSSKDPETIAKTAGVLKELVDRAASIVSNLMEFTQQNDTMVPVNIRGILERDLRFMTAHMEEHGVTVEKDFEAVPDICCRPAKISHVFLSLMLNAVHAMKKSSGRVLKIRIAACSSRAAQCTVDNARDCMSDDGCIKISFKDSGCGVPESVRKNLFAPFVTTCGVLGGGDQSAPGTGLGLFVSYGIVKNHGGFIFLESSDETGSLFTVVLPVNKSCIAS